MALDANRKLIVNYLVGGRHAKYADAFMFDLAGRLKSWVQLTTDGHKVYLETVEGAFDSDMGYAILVKLHGPTSGGTTGRYGPAECIGIKKTAVTSSPDEAHVSTSYVERQNLAMRR
jgi:hypothetical protein